MLDFSCKRTMDVLYKAYRKCMRRILKLPYQTHCNVLYVLDNCSSIDCILHKRFFNFFCKCTISNNSVISLLSKSAIHGSMSKMCKSLNYICRLYCIDKSNICKYDANKICNVFCDTDLQKGYLIKDFMLLRDDNPSDPDIKTLINDLCIM